MYGGWRSGAVVVAAALAWAAVLPGCGRGAELGVGGGEFHRHAFEAPDGRERHYLVYVPAAADQQVPAPVVLVFHGGGGNAEQASRGTFSPESADAAGFVAVYPQGVGPKRFGRQFGTWNGDTCCGAAAEEDVDDVVFIDELLGRLSTEYEIDPERVYATGISNGGIMAARLACELSGRIAAISSVSGPGYTEGCQPERPIPVQLIHGTADRCARYEGGDACGACFQEVLREGLGLDVEDVRFPCQSVTDQAAHYRRVNGCTESGAVVYENGAASCVAYAECTSGQPVEVCTITGAGHVWPGRAFTCNPERRMCRARMNAVGPATKDLDANREIARFFRAAAPAR